MTSEECPPVVGILLERDFDARILPAIAPGKKKRRALNIIDYSSHFQMVVPLNGHSPEAIWLAYQQWTRIFGPPRHLYVDQGTEFKGSFKRRVTSEGTNYDMSSLESPFQRGITERHGKTFKIMLDKMLVEHQCEDMKQWTRMVNAAIMTKNRLANRGGFSPAQRVLGFQPRIPGGLMTSESYDFEANSPATMGDKQVEDAMKLCKAAAQAFFEADCDQALENALSGGPRPQQEYTAGQMVYFYRLGHSKKGDRLPQLWHGPARVVVTDPPSTLWLSYQGGIVKAWETMTTVKTWMSTQTSQTNRSSGLADAYAQKQISQ